MDSYITRGEHEEFVKRMEEEHKRQNARIGASEKAIEQNNKLLISVEKLALSMENMQKEQKDQGERLETLEGRDGEMWRKVVSHLLTAAISIFVTYIFSKMGM